MLGLPQRYDLPVLLPQVECSVVSVPWLVPPFFGFGRDGGSGVGFQGFGVLGVVGASSREKMLPSSYESSGFRVSGWGFDWYGFGFRCSGGFECCGCMV